MARTWLPIRVDLIEGHGEQYWPRPGRIFADARSHTLKQLASAIDDAFGRWDRSHLQEFTLADGTRLCDPDPDGEIEGEVTGDYRRVKLSRLHPESSSPTCSTSATTGPTCAPSARGGSTRSRSWVVPRCTYGVTTTNGIGQG